MEVLLRQLESEFGKTIAVAAEKVGRTGESKNVPAADIYALVTRATILFAAVMSHGSMTREEFLRACGMVFDGVEKKAPLSKGDRAGDHG